MAQRFRAFHSHPLPQLPAAASRPRDVGRCLLWGQRAPLTDSTETDEAKGCLETCSYLAGIDVSLQVARADHGRRDQAIIDVLAVTLPGLEQAHHGGVQHV